MSQWIKKNTAIFNTIIKISKKFFTLILYIDYKFILWIITEELLLVLEIGLEKQVNQLLVNKKVGYKSVT